MPNQIAFTRHGERVMHCKRCLAVADEFWDLIGLDTL